MLTGPGLVIANGIMIALAVIIVALRMYTRMFLLRWLGIDDLFILIAAVRISLLTSPSLRSQFPRSSQLA